MDSMEAECELYNHIPDRFLLQSLFFAENDLRKYVKVAYKEISRNWDAKFSVHSMLFASTEDTYVRLRSLCEGCVCSVVKW